MVGVRWDTPVRDTLHLASLPGVVDRLLQQCHDIGGPRLTRIRRVRDAVTVDFAGCLADLLPLRMFSTLSVVLGECDERGGDASDAPDIAATVSEVLRRSRDGGVLRVLRGEPRFRVDASPARQRLIDTVTATLGWPNDPHRWDVNLASADGLLLAQVGALHRSRRYGTPLERVPASVNPLIGALLVQLAKPRPGEVVLDPCCGSGTLLVEVDAAVDGCGALLGGDVSGRALRAAMANLRAVKHPVGLFRARAERLPLPAESVDRVVSNLPFGKRVGSHRYNQELYPALLAEVTRLLRPEGRAVLLTEDKRLLERSVEATRGLRVIKETRLSSGGIHPTAYTIERTRAARRRSRREGRRGRSAA